MNSSWSCSRQKTERARRLHSRNEMSFKCPCCQATFTTLFSVHRHHAATHPECAAGCLYNLSFPQQMQPAPPMDPKMLELLQQVRSLFVLV